MPTRYMGITKATSCTRPSLITMHRNNRSVCYEDNQTELGASHLEIRANLGAVMFQSLW